MDIIGKLKDKYTFLQFGISNILPTKFDNVTQLLDVPIRKLSCYYYGVGTYLGVDTGDRHLMTAVGGKTIVLHPNDNIDYSHKEWHYSKDIVTYVNFNSYEQIYNLL